MAKKVSGVALRGKSAKGGAQHDDDEDEQVQVSKAQEDDDEEDEDNEAKALDEDDEDDEDDEVPSPKNAARLAAAKAERQAARKMKLYARAVADLCSLAGKPELAADFIAKGVATGDVSKTLLAQRASASSAAEIAGQRGPDDSPGAVAAMWDHATEKNAKAFGLAN